MRLRHFLLCGLMFVLLLAGCAPLMQPPLEALDNGATRSTTGNKLAKVDNFQVIIDSSLSMDENATNDFLIARDVVRRINQGIPTDLNYRGGLRSIGHNSHQSEKLTELLYGMTSYEKSAFHQALGKIKYVGGSTPMAAALRAAGSDLKATSGPSALILVSDGLHMADAPDAAKEIKQALGQNLCIYTIAIGNENNGAGQDMMKELAHIGQCGFATTAAALADDAAMNSFVDKVFVGGDKPAPKPKDSDGDGVIDAKDRCPDTPRGVRVDMNGCPLDSDGDGVYDYLDKCPGTPKGTPVDASGCPIVTDGDSDGDGVLDSRDKCPDTPRGVSVDADGCPTKLTLKINFALDSDVVDSRYMGEIAKAAACVKDYPGNVVFVDGHTDSQGSSEYNQTLSERRASAVVKALVDNFDIPAYRLTARGFGEDSPVATNETSEGRKQNRRVDVACGATE